MTSVASPQIEATSVPAATRPWLLASALAIAGSMLAFVVLHLVSPRDPVQDAVSLYAFTEQVPGLLAISMVLLAVGSATTLGALAAARVPLDRTTWFLFVLWCGGLVVAAAFPVSHGESPDLLSGEIHQYACVVAFLSIPAIAFALLGRTRGIVALAHNRAIVARWTRYSAASLALFGASYLLAKCPDVPVISELSTILPVGLTQRVALIVDFGLLCAILLLARAACAPAGTINSHPAHELQDAGTTYGTRSDVVEAHARAAA
jgi:Protein of unknown function (DUF998)